VKQYSELASAQTHPVTASDPLRLATAAYLARFEGSSRDYASSDLRCYLAWCTERGLDPLTARRPHLELYIRWMQEIRRFKPSTVSRRFSVVAGFYRTCVIDDVLERSPTEHVRRPAVPAESPTLGFTHLQFEAMPTARPAVSQPERLRARGHARSARPSDLEATRSDIADIGEKQGHRVLRVCGKGTKVVLVSVPPAVGRAIDRAIGSRASGPILRRPRRFARRDTFEQVMAMSQEQKAAALAGAVQVLGLHGAVAEDVLGKLWDESFEQGRLAALDELQDRFCVCMK
jgi:integrase/recombinase XerD